MSIVVRNVSKRFSDFTALEDVSLEVASGSLTALLGPSGSGKSTLLRVIAGLEQPDEGEIVISGEDATGVAPQKRGVGFVFQHYAAFKHMTVRDNVAFGLTIRKRPKEEIRARVAELLELVQLQPFAHRYPAQLSGGQRQRMALARALAVEPEVLLLDEPFGALDARVRAELREWLRRLHDEVHVTTVFVTHDQEEAMEVADRIAVMNKGRIEQVGGPRDLYEHPETEFVMSFVGPVNQVGDTWVRPHDLELLWPSRRERRRGDDRADRPPRLRGPGRADARRRRAALGAGDARPLRGARAGRGPDRLPPPAARAGLQRTRFDPLDEIRERCLLEHAAHARRAARSRRPGATLARRRSVTSSGRLAAHARDRALDGADDVGDG